ncbi:hypothetical protein AXF42_Ash018929 [Apostasia shenzhenica]|uniref:NAD(P)H-quinone oxidoreductase subunit L, chloroplastic n=1 Tax=Apostasia shenzhenica TaxID=1088818 RepID=A0A2I0B4L9_9ASPA|nr:hypothetical protein AXF42_Ash018929 [Apostasia shenzhenica]
MSCCNLWQSSILACFQASPLRLPMPSTPPYPTRLRAVATLPDFPIARRLSSRAEALRLPSLLRYGALLASVATPAALAVTAENNVEEDLMSGIAAAFYFLIAPPIIMNWLRLRWYKRNFFEMYFQFMFAFIFFPGLMLSAPFLNFRPLPRDSTMKYPWSTPKDDATIYKSR